MRKEKNKLIISGYKDLCTALNINSKNGNIDTDRKMFYRMVKRYNFPLHRKGNRIYMSKEDIDAINDYYLLGIPKIAEYMGIHKKTLYKWLKQFPKMPIDRKRKIAFIPELYYWYANLIFERSKHFEDRIKSSIKRFKKNAPIIAGATGVFRTLEFAGVSHIKEIRPYIYQAFGKYKLLSFR